MPNRIPSEVSKANLATTCCPVCARQGIVARIESLVALLRQPTAWVLRAISRLIRPIHTIHCDRIHALHYPQFSKAGSTMATASTGLLARLSSPGTIADLSDDEDFRIISDEHQLLGSCISDPEGFRALVSSGRLALGLHRAILLSPAA